MGEEDEGGAANFIPMESNSKGDIFIYFLEEKMNRSKWVTRNTKQKM